ncbi:unnamed protein product [Bursaphelenchus okinawaensis]|uniref:Protein with SprT-like domain at the N terminus n=1 Tax=Bursaphelenchus okinawaensis TaxID=465554 RepID=A0A811L985_9BILA|nr:unnamed protein product [Bursaphelenchus okinawaensis]CAG9119738.1 unnamed protein product [Bursaphelenchus okinawaensis]
MDKDIIHVPSSSCQMNLADPDAELYDPTPDLLETFRLFDFQFFEGSLQQCVVEWSKKMSTCAGICYFKPRLGHCIIRLSEPLLKLRSRKNFVETLLHEMIHAYLFLHGSTDGREDHGPMFQDHMRRINEIANVNITVYHSFHDEVRLYKQHWWRCNGRCQGVGPFYGYVKRSMNRAPSKNDTWWKSHQQLCGGTFIKVKEPENYKKKEKTGKVKKSKTISVPNPKIDISNYFKTGLKDSQPVVNATKEPEVICLEDSEEEDVVVDEQENNVSSVATTSAFELLFQGEGVKLGGSQSREKTSQSKALPNCELVICPNCPKRVPLGVLNAHLDECLS